MKHKTKTKALCWLLSLVMVLSLLPTLGVTALADDAGVHTDPSVQSDDVLARFSDVDSGKWYADALRWAISNGVMNGYSNGAFGPDDSTTRAMIATVLWRMEGSPVVTGTSAFSDVKDGDWYAPAVLWASENKIITGDTDGSFSPNAAATREELAAILYSYAQSKGKTDQGAWMFLLDFPDVNEVSDWAGEAVRWMVKEELVNGMDGKLNPNGEATRAQFAAMLMRCSALEETTEAAEAKPVPIIIDADIGNSTDDAFALEIAYRLMDMDYLDLKGVVVSRIGDGYPDLADIYNTYYGYPDIPIGVERDGITGSKVYIDQRPLDELTNSDGTKMFARTDEDFSDNLEGYQLYRKILSEAEDHSVKIVVTGFVSAIVSLMESEPDEYSDLTGLELIRQKVDSLYFMGTKLGDPVENTLGYNLKYDFELAQAFFANWPAEVPAYLSPSPVGDTIEYRPERVIADLSFNEVNPIYQTYTNWDCDTGQMMWDPLCVINAAFPEVFEYSATGNVIVSDDKTISFIETPDGAFRYQIAGDEVWCSEILSYIRYYTMMH